MGMKAVVEGAEIKFEAGDSLLDIIRSAGIRLTSPCGGKGTCGKCMVKVSQTHALNPPSEAEMKLLEKEDLDQGYRLACQTFPEGVVSVSIPEESREMTLELLLKHATIRKIDEPALTVIEIPFDGAVDAKGYGQRMDEGMLLNCLSRMDEPERKRAIQEGKLLVWLDEGRLLDVSAPDTKKFGVALDIGSTTMVAYAFDIAQQKIVSAEAMTNPQRQYGEDIMTRIDHAMKSPAQKKTLEGVLRKGASELAAKLAEKCRIKTDDVLRLTFVGNTAMHHFFLGLDVTRLGKVPFQPETTQSITVNGSGIGLTGLERCVVNSPPLIAGYVGADHIAVLLAADLEKATRPTAAIDIGTNAEIGVALNGDIMSCSAAAGPAFEGGNISHGMRATDGAICRVWSEAGVLKFETIGGKEPVGLCGSGLIDFVAECLRLGYVDSAGNLNPDGCGDKLIGRTGNSRYVIWSSGRKEVSVSQADIRQLQLAKAAMHAGLEILMSKMRVAELDRLLLAGAFGANMSTRNGRFIGMFPEIPLNKIVPIGNAAGTGAIQLLSDIKARTRVEEIAKITKHVELSSEKDFQRRFIAALDFPHQDAARYPESSRMIKIKVQRKK